MIDVHARLAEWNLVLPAPARPVANYASYVLHRDLLFVSGSIPIENGRPAFIGRIPNTISMAQGYAAARLCALGILAQIGAALGGQFDRVEHLLKLVGLIHAEAGFVRLPEVMNGASDLFAHVFGARGVCARTTFGVVALPQGVSIEIDATIAVSCPARGA